MKKLLLLIILTTITGLGANAQCTPDPQYTQAGVYPDSATNFAGACVGVLYEQLVTNVVPVDTMTTIGGIPVTLDFDSVVISSFSGLPPGFTYTCNAPQNTTSPVNGCAYEGGTIGCLLITGTPTAADIGTHNLSITVDAYLGGVPTPTSTQIVDYYTIVVEDCPAGLNEFTKAQFKVSPNPANDFVQLEGLEGLDVSSLTVTDANGKVISTYTNITGDAHELNVSSLDNGMYFVRIHHSNSVDVVRFVKK